MSSHELPFEGKIIPGPSPVADVRPRYDSMRAEHKQLLDTAGLTERQKRVQILRAGWDVGRGRTQRETAELMGATVSAVKGLDRRGFAKLKPL